MRFPAHRRLMLAVLLISLTAVAAACTSEEPVRTRDDASPLYVAIGASDSVGTGARDPASQGWVVVLHGKMPSGTRLANLGIAGLRLDQAIDQVLPVALDLQPSTVTVWMAVNDLANGMPLESYRADLDTLLGSLNEGTRARVYVANIPDLTVLPALRQFPPAELRAEIERWNAAIAESAAAHGAVLVDLYTGWSELRERPDYISRDGIHPSTRGHARIADIFWRRMEGGGRRE